MCRVPLEDKMTIFGIQQGQARYIRSPVAVSMHFSQYWQWLRFEHPAFSIEHQDDVKQA